MQRQRQGGGVGEGLEGSRREAHLGGGCSWHRSDKQGVAHSMLSNAVPDCGPVPAV